MDKGDRLKKIKRIGLYIVLALGVLGVADTIMLIPVTSSVTLGMAFPAGAGIVLIAFSVLNLTKNKPYFKNRTILKIIAAVLAAGAIFFFTIEAFIWNGAHSKEAENTEANYVVVLGCGIFPDGSLTLTLKNRLDEAYDYMQKYPGAVCVVSGGRGSNEPMPEAQAMAEYLKLKGVEDERIIREEHATSTKENLIYSYALMSKEYPDREKTAAIVSSDFHIFRVKFLAKRFGLAAMGIPCETPWYIRPNCYIREFFGVMKSFFLDK